MDKKLSQVGKGVSQIDQIASLDGKENNNLDKKNTLNEQANSNSRSVLEIIRDNKGMVFAVILALAASTGGCKGCDCSGNGKGNELYFGCDPENNRVVCGQKNLSEDDS